MTVPEAPLESTDGGLIPAGEGWFVLNANDARWHLEGTGQKLAFFEGKAERWMLGLNVSVLEPGQQMAMCHFEPEQEDFLVISGDALLIVEGEERPLRAWDLVHCPPGARHVIVGAGDGPCVIVAVGSRGAGGGDFGYPFDVIAAKHDASSREDTTNWKVAYARFPERQTTPYEGWLP